METDLHIIRFSGMDDMDSIVDFLRKHWKKDHVLIKSPNLFRFQYTHYDKLNFAIAINKKSSEINGILGFINYADAFDNSDIFSAIWKVENKTGDIGLGIKLIEYFSSEIKYRSFTGSGARIETLPIWKLLGYKTDKLKHYYILNTDISEYSIAVVPENYKMDSSAPKQDVCYDLTKINDFSHLMKVFSAEKYKDRKPYKEPWYINKRYFEYPFYKYGVYGINKNGQIESILITRVVHANGAKILRIVDFIGIDEDLVGISEGLNKLIYTHRYEYIDFYLYGIDDGILKKAGFLLRSDNDEITLPYYFEPFKQENHDILFFSTEKDKIYIFKGDGDQDRPNVLMDN